MKITEDDVLKLMVAKPYKLEDLFIELVERGNHLGLMNFVLNLIE